ncbi:Phosphoheptose isomerase [Chlamydiales bacterium STE3]|nr:Phosphoheptose isomerase [Chlamydiales bacterium STE3]
MMQQQILSSIEDSASALEQLKMDSALQFIEKVAHLLAKTFESGGKVLVAGNGGSLCDASHFSEELTGMFRNYRRALPAISLAEPGHITCVGNDLGYEWIFSRAVEAYGKPNDIFIGLTTSGKSLNMIRAFETAKQYQLKTVAFLGKGGGPLRGIADLELIIDGFKTSDRIQEAHMTAMHIIIEIMEQILFPEMRIGVKDFSAFTTHQLENKHC